MRNKKQNSKQQSKKVVRQQPRKDDSSKRINEDNARVSKVEQDLEKSAKYTSANDVSWYNRNPELLKAAGSLPFASMLGQDLYSQVAVPGILKLCWSPAVGGEYGIPINQAFNSMYSYIVHANSRNYNYEPQDLGILCIAGSQVFAAISTVIRVYGIVKYYQERNLYYPDAMIYALGFDAADVRRNLGNLWFQINNLIDQTRQIWIPNTLPIFDRWSWLNSEVFTDAPGVASQSYVFVQDRYFIYSETASNTGGMLVPVTVSSDGESGSNILDPGSHRYSVKEWVDVIQLMINHLVNSEDRGMIFGDILNAYGADKIRAMSQIPSDYVIQPAYNAEVLTQIENWMATDKYINAIGQYNGKIVEGWARNQAPGVSSILPYNVQKTILNFHMPEQPTPEQIMVATRMRAEGYAQSTKFMQYDRTEKTWISDGKVVGLTCYGSELPHHFYIVDESWTQTNVAPVYDAVEQVIYKNQEDNSHLEFWLSMMAFDWHPFLYITPSPLEVVESTGEVKINAFSQTPAAGYGDYDNYIQLDHEVLRKLHRVALFSLWGVPHF